MSDTSNAPAIMWFRYDLRLSDNPALHAAISSGRPVICLYIHDEETGGLREHGGASKWWLDKSLRSLTADLEAIGGSLTLKSGKAADMLDSVIEETGAEAVFWNRRYELAEREIDTTIKEDLTERGIGAESYKGSLLTEPWEIKTGSGGWYKVFTPYWKSVRANYQPAKAFGTPKTMNGMAAKSDNLDSWSLHPSAPDWSNGIEDKWIPGEAGALSRLEDFLDKPVSHYTEQRNRPDLEHGTSGLSPHLRWGEIGPAQIWRAVKHKIEQGKINEDNAMVFLSEIVWREFSYVLLFYNPQLADENYNDNFKHMPWRSSDSDYKAWCKGETGYPIVDAGMRQLWTTGWMHNRVRMIVASFLTKHLLIEWQRGEDWFWDTLVDADPASNAASWQWTAGSGADAAPYFRVFNPITQGEKFDETGDYTRKWVPELAGLPNKYLFKPWEAPKDVLAQAHITLGEDYPKPIVEHKAGRERALEAYDILKEKRDAA